MANRALGFGYLLRLEDPELSGVIITDQGGRTRYGVSERSFPEYWKRGMAPSLNDAANVFVNSFWVPLGCDIIQPQELANVLAAAGYNCGMRTAARIFQQCVNQCLASDHPKLKVDGKIGPITLSYFMSAQGSVIAAEGNMVVVLKELLKEYYVSINMPGNLSRLNV